MRRGSLGDSMLIATLLAGVLQTNAPDGFPKQAHVQLECIAGPNETSSNCRTVEVSHPGQGLEQAALAAVRLGLVRERSGVSLGQAFRVRIVFRLADEGDDLAPQQPSSAEARPDAN